MKQSKLHRKILWIAETAMLLALLIALQWATSSVPKPLGQFVTGSCVNAVLAVSALMVGLWAGILVAAISPFVAFVLQIGPAFIQLIPAIALGNIVLVVVIWLIAHPNECPVWRKAVGWAGASVAKFLTLFLVMTRWLIPNLTGSGVIPQKGAANLLFMFSWPQLVTALIGSAVALVIVPLIKKALKRN